MTIGFKHGRSGYQKHNCRCSVCRQSEIVYKRTYRALHRRKLNEQMNRWRQLNREKVREMDRERYASSPEIRLKKRLYHDTESQKVYRRRYREINREKIRNHYLEAYAKNPLRFYVNAKRWKDAHKDRVNEISREYQRKRRREDPAFRLRLNLGRRISRAIEHGMKAGKTLELLGCSVLDLKRHLESLFKDGMTWENYGKWHVDHIRPCVSFNLADPEQQKKCFNWKNLQPLWATENYRKSGKAA